MNLDFGKYYEVPGTPTAKAMADLHRHDDVVNDVQKRQDDVVNDAVKFTEKEEIAVKALIRDPGLSAARLADILGIKQRQAERIIASLRRRRWWGTAVEGVARQCLAEINGGGQRRIALLFNHIL